MWWDKIWEFLTVSEGTFIASLLIALVGYIMGLKTKKQITAYQETISKLYPELKSFIDAAFDYQNNVNSFSYNDINNINKLDEAFFFPKLKLEKSSFVISLFFPERQRKCFTNIENAVVMFNFKLSNLNRNKLDIELMNQYDSARRNFNKAFDKEMTVFQEMVFKRYGGRWSKSHKLCSLRERLKRH